jgi:hypothetical protein
MEKIKIKIKPKNNCVVKIAATFSINPRSLENTFRIIQKGRLYRFFQEKIPRR